MSQAVVNPAVEYFVALFRDPACRLSPTARHVARAMADHWNRDTHTTYVSVGCEREDGTRVGLMLETALSDRAIRYALRELEDAGELAGQPRTGRSTIWRFPNVPTPASVAGVGRSTPALGAGVPLHLVHPSVNRTPAYIAGTPATDAGTPATDADEPVLEPVSRTSAPPSVSDGGPVVLSDQRIAEIISRHYTGQVRPRRRGVS